MLFHLPLNQGLIFAKDILRVEPSAAGGDHFVLMFADEREGTEVKEGSTVVTSALVEW